MMDHRAVEAASEALDRHIGESTGEADRDVHAVDLIVDILLGFPPDVADGIIERVVRDNTEDRKV